MRTPFIASISLAVMLTAGLPSPRHAGAAPDNTRGMAILSAYVAANGTLQDGVGALSASKGMLAGIYQVRFNRDVADCFYAATQSSRDAGFFSPGSTVASAPDTTSDTLAVVVYDANGERKNAKFQLLVFCSR